MTTRSIMREGATRVAVWPATAVLLLLGLLAIGTCGGAAARTRGATLVADGSGPAWPEPPEAPRIEFLKGITSPLDLGIKKSFFRRVAEFFGGEMDDRILQPYGIAVDPKGRIYVADSAAQVVHMFDPAGKEYKALSGTKQERFRSPVGVAIDPEGRLFVSDPELGIVLGLDGRRKPFFRISEGLRRPTGLAFSAANNLLYVVDTALHQILAFDLTGNLRHSFGGRGSGDGQFNFPTNITVDRQGTLYVTDSMNFRVQILAADGRFLGGFGRAGDALGDFANPKGVAVNSEGHIFVVEGLYDVVNVFDREGRLLLTFGGPGVGRGQSWLATGLFIDAADRVYLADSFNGRIQVFQYLRQEM